MNTLQRMRVSSQPTRFKIISTCLSSLSWLFFNFQQIGSQINAGQSIELIQSSAVQLNCPGTNTINMNLVPWRNINRLCWQFAIIRSTTFHFLTNETTLHMFLNMRRNVRMIKPSSYSLLQSTCSFIMSSNFMIILNHLW